MTPIWLTWLVRVMKCQVGNIEIKRGRSEVWTTLCIEIIIIVIHNTKMSKKNKTKNKQTNYQTNKEKEKENKPMLGLT